MYKNVVKNQFPAKQEFIGEAVQFVETNLNSFAEQKEKVQLLLSVEEVLVQLCNRARGDNTQVNIQISANKKGNRIRLSCIGEAISLDDVNSLGNLTEADEIDEEQRRLISSMVLKLFSDRIRIKHRRGVNYVTLTMQPMKHSNTTIICMAAGILVGFLVRCTLPDFVTDFLMTNFATVISDIFMNALQMVLGMLVFFSIAEAISGFSDFSTFGRVGGKTIGMYFFTTFLALFVGLGVVALFHPGSVDLLPEVQALMGNSNTVSTAEISIRNTLVNIVPSNFIMIFVNADMLQIIFVGILLGIAAGLLEESSESVQRFIHAGNELFSKVTSMITYFLPAAVFCIMVNMVATTGKEALVSIVKVCLCFAFGATCMQFVYAILLVIFRINPLQFYRRIYKVAVTAFSTCSSCATMPVTMQCLDDIGVSSKIYSFSIPLGATINMDGATIEYLLYTLFMARIFDVPINLNTLLPLCISIILLSLATPGTSGSVIAMVALLLTQIGIPAEAVCFLLAAMTINDFLCTTNNVLGDTVVTTIVAQSEGLLNQEKFNTTN